MHLEGDILMGANINGLSFLLVEKNPMYYSLTLM